MVPTCGSSMILNASMASGSVSSGLATFLAVVDVDGLERLAVGGRRQVVDHRVEERLYALVLEGRDRYGIELAGCVALRISRFSVSTSGILSSR